MSSECSSPTEYSYFAVQPDIVTRRCSSFTRSRLISSDTGYDRSGGKEASTIAVGCSLRQNKKYLKRNTLTLTKIPLRSSMMSLGISSDEDTSAANSSSTTGNKQIVCQYCQQPIIGQPSNGQPQNNETLNPKGPMKLTADGVQYRREIERLKEEKTETLNIFDSAVKLYQTDIQTLKSQLEQCRKVFIDHKDKVMQLSKVKGCPPEDIYLMDDLLLEEIFPLDSSVILSDSNQQKQDNCEFLSRERSQSYIKIDNDLTVSPTNSSNAVSPQRRGTCTSVVVMTSNGTPACCQKSTEEDVCAEVPTDVRSKAVDVEKKEHGLKDLIVNFSSNKSRKVKDRRGSSQLSKRAAATAHLSHGAVAKSGWRSWMAFKPFVNAPSACHPSTVCDKQKFPQLVHHSGQMRNTVELWVEHIIPYWGHQKNAPLVQKLLECGIPDDVRGEVWKKAIGNDLRVTPVLYKVLLYHVRNIRRHLMTASVKYRHQINETVYGVSMSSDSLPQVDGIAAQDPQKDHSSDMQLPPVIPFSSSPTLTANIHNTSANNILTKDCIISLRQEQRRITLAECLFNSNTKLDSKAVSLFDEGPTPNNNCIAQQLHDDMPFHPKSGNALRRVNSVPCFSEVSSLSPTSPHLSHLQLNGQKLRNGRTTPSGEESKKLSNSLFASTLQGFGDLEQFNFEVHFDDSELLRSDVISSFQTISVDLHRTFPRLGVFQNNLADTPDKTPPNNSNQITQQGSDSTPLHRLTNESPVQKHSAPIFGTDKCSTGVRPLPFSVPHEPIMYEHLRSVLEAFSVFRKDIGYVQGMAYVAAVLLLYMDEYSSFVCLSNLMLRPSIRSFYQFDEKTIEIYFRTFDILFREKQPTIFDKFVEAQLSTNVFLVEWFYTLFTRCLPFDIVSRVWDNFILNGDIVLFQTGLTFMTYFQDTLKKSSVEECMSMLSASSTEHFSLLDVEKFFECYKEIGLTKERLTKIMKSVTASYKKNSLQPPSKPHSSIVSKVLSNPSSPRNDSSNSTKKKSARSADEHSLRVSQISSPALALSFSEMEGQPQLYQRPLQKRFLAGMLGKKKHRAETSDS